MLNVNKQDEINLFNKIRRAIMAGISAFNGQALAPSDVPNALDWDDFTARYARYRHYQNYYFNIIYTSLVQYADKHKTDEYLYKFIKPIYNPIARYTDLYVSQVFGGILDMENASKADSAIPIKADDAILQALIKLWKDSRWQDNKSLFVRQTAMKGDGILKVVEDRTLGTVRMEVIPPGQIANCEFDNAGNVVACTIVQVRRDSDNAPAYIYEERITPESFSTFRDGSPYAFYQNALGEDVQTWDNDYGFVPIVTLQHKDIGKKWGATGFHNTINKIDGLNSLVSMLDKHIAVTVDPPLVSKGTRAPELLTLTNARGSRDVIHLDGDASLEELVSSVDILGSLEVIREYYKEIERDLPELTLSKAREMGQEISGVALRTINQDIIQHIQEVRGNYSGALVRAQQMAMYIGSQNGYKGYTQLGRRANLDEFTHEVKQKPVFTDSMSKVERIQAMQADDFPPYYVAQELDFSEDESILIEAQIKDNQTMQVANFVQQTMNSQGQGVNGNNGTGVDFSNQTETDQPAPDETEEALNA